jgi:Ala-tRNA(Pro) deacylase
VESTEHAVYDALARLEIGYERHEHPPADTVAQAVEHWAGITATHCKNLFLRNAKGNRHYLVVVEHLKPVDLRGLADRIGDDRLSFGSAERLAKHLGLTPGSVSPFGLINDPGHTVRVIVDADLRNAAWVTFHPNVNTVTLKLSFQDFERFLASTGHTVRYVRI